MFVNNLAASVDQMVMNNKSILYNTSHDSHSSAAFMCTSSADLRI